VYKKLIINVTEHETRVALLEDGTIAELFIERRDDSDITGNIYKGRVQRVLPGMQAAFVDIGLDQAAFIYVSDIGGTYPDTDDKVTINDWPDHECFFTPGHRDCPIEDLLTEGQDIMVQVAKSPIGTKGSRITSYISLPVRFLVLMPTSGHIGISRRIEDEKERNRLRQLVLSLRKDNIGYIIRTAAEGLEEDKIISEMKFLNNLWENIQNKYKVMSAPCLIHQELTVSLRAVRDLLTREVQSLIIDSREGYEAILSFLDTFMPSLKNAVELYEGTEPIFDAYNLEGDISRALKRKVWLKSGGYIIIEQTEALTVIDVNTGRYVGKHNLEETILKTNLEAVKEIAYQIRLRDIGGIIIIDFIDMEKRGNQDKVFNALKDAFKKDRSKTHILPMSEMGLIQMTRKRVRKSIHQILCEPCFYCEGEGKLISRQTICYMVYREALRNAYDMTGHQLTIHVHPQIAELLHGEENHLISALEQKIGRQVMVYPNPKFHLEEFDIIEVQGG
jgi:ribonuclease G